MCPRALIQQGAGHRLSPLDRTRFASNLSEAPARSRSTRSRPAAVRRTL
jgi:hypothetical protein